MGETLPVGRRSARHEARREALLGIAARTINSHGVGAINLNDIASEVGLSRNALYHYLGDRDDLAFECYRRACEASLADLADALETAADPISVLQDYIERALAFERPQYATLGDYEALPEVRRDMILALRAQLVAGLASIVDAGIAAGAFRPCNSETVAQTLLGMVAWVQLSAGWLGHRDGPGTRQRSAAAMHRLLIHGLSAPGHVLPPMPPLVPQGFNAFDRRAAAEAKADQLVAAASRLFNRRGVDSVSLDDIGASVGATKGVIYHYFADKTRLVVRCLERGFDLYDQFMAVAAARQGSGCAKALTLHHLNCQAQAGPLAPMILQQGMGALHETDRARFVARAQRLWRQTNAIIREGIADGSCRPCDDMMTAEVAAGAFFWLPKWVAMDDPRSPTGLADELVAIVGSGIARRDA